jgi:hypothetical protein
VTEPDYAVFLIRAENEMKKIYPSLLEGKNKDAFGHALQTIKHLQEFMSWIIENKAKG